MATILLIEDDESIRKLLTDYLVDHLGHVVVHSRWGEDAPGLCRQHHPALVMMDIRLPGIDGVAALALLRTDPDCAQTPVVAVTASHTSLDRARLRTAGFDAIHAKPVSLATVREIVARWVPRAPV